MHVSSHSSLRDTAASTMRTEPRKDSVHMCMFVSSSPVVRLGLLGANWTWFTFAGRYAFYFTPKASPLSACRHSGYGRDGDFHTPVESCRTSEGPCSLRWAAAAQYRFEGCPFLRLSLTMKG